MAPPKKQIDMGIIARSLKQINDRLDIYDFTIQSVHKTLFHLTEKVDRQEAMVCALQTKVFGPERGPVVETCAGFSSTARLRYPKTDANDDNNISRISSIAIHPVSGESISELGHHVHLRRDEHPIHYHLDHLDRLSNCSTWTPTPVSHSHNAPTGRQEVIPHCHNGSTHPQQSPNIEMHTVGHAVAPHTRCIGTSDSTSLTTNTHVVKCQATQTTTPNIVANVFNKQSSQATVQRMLHCFTCGGGGPGHKSRGCTSPKKRCVSCGGYGHATIDCPNCYALSRKQIRRRNGPRARNCGGNISTGTPGSTSGGGCGHLLLGCSNHRKPTHRHRRLRREPKARERGEHYSTAHCTVSYQHSAPDRTTHSVKPADSSPIAHGTVNSPVHATISSVEPKDISPIAYDTVSSPASATLKPLTPPDVRAPTYLFVLCVATHSHRLQLPATNKLQWICCFPMTAPTLMRTNTTVGHAYTGRRIMV